MFKNKLKITLLLLGSVIFFVYLCGINQLKLKEMKTLLVLGNITFHHFEADELKLFKKNTYRKALVHDIECIVECESEDEAEILGEDSLGSCCESYLIPSVFEKSGEVAYDCQNNNLPISVEDFKKDYLN